MVDDLIKKGLQQHHAGHFQEAKRLYEQALGLEPRHPDALHLAGVVALQAGNAERAVALIQQAIEVQPENPAFHANLAQAYLALQRVADAHAAFRRAAVLDPRDPQLAVGAANCLAMQGSVAEAERQLRAVVQQHPGFAPAWFNLGNTVRDQDRLDEALQFYRRATRLEPSFADAHNNLGGALHALERLEEAEQAYRTCLKLQPDYVIGDCNLASVLVDQGRFAEAEAACRRALELQPGLREAQTILGAALAHQGRFEEVLELERAALAREPDNARALCSLGNTLCLLGHADEGLPLLERAVAAAPDAPELRYFRGTARLTCGDFSGGWEDCVFRPARAEFIAKHPDIPLATALPAALHGKDVCLVSEQGIGDEIFFLRFAPLLKARGAEITCCVTPKIATFLVRSPALARVVHASDALSAADFTLLVGDLPLALGGPAAPATPPALALTALPKRLDEMRKKLVQLGPPPYLGLTWRGGKPPREQRGTLWVLYKEIAPAKLVAALKAVPGTLLALQRRPAAGEIEELQRQLGRAVHDLSPLNEDLEGMLALLALIDDYVGVSNANMHLRAGVGRTARVLVPCPAEWRWMATGDESPWFPGFRIYRQQLDGDWGPALARLAQDLLMKFG